jgi:hypothetical protein
MRCWSLRDRARRFACGSAANEATATPGAYSAANEAALRGLRALAGLLAHAPIALAPAEGIGWGEGNGIFPITDTDTACPDGFLGNTSDRLHG